jgi:phosphatidylserine/phosphatidylglycerophosphate/cardiolipin synthase-like enzyme
MTDPAIASALEEARERGVAVRIITDQERAYGRHSETPFLKWVRIGPKRL